MQINIRLYGPLRDHLPPESKGRASLEFEAGATVQEIFTQLNLPLTLLVTLNQDQEASTETPLQDGDQVALFAPVSGG